MIIPVMGRAPGIRIFKRQSAIGVAFGRQAPGIGIDPLRRPAIGILRRWPPGIRVAIRWPPGIWVASGDAGRRSPRPCFTGQQGQAAPCHRDSSPRPAESSKAGCSPSHPAPDAMLHMASSSPTGVPGASRPPFLAQIDAKAMLEAPSSAGVVRICWPHLPKEVKELV